MLLAAFSAPDQSAPRSLARRHNAAPIRRRTPQIVQARATTEGAQSLTFLLSLSSSPTSLSFSPNLSVPISLARVVVRNSLRRVQRPTYPRRADLERSQQRQQQHTLLPMYPCGLKRSTLNSSRSKRGDIPGTGDEDRPLSPLWKLSIPRRVSWVDASKQTRQ